MRRHGMHALVLGLLAVAACTSSGTSTPSSSSSIQRGSATCTAASASDAHQFVLAADGFNIACGRVTKGTTVLFVNDTGQPADVTLAQGGADDFDAQLPNEGSTYAHAFNAPGSYAITAKPSGSLTLFVE